ncbi:unnamed protein product [Effrenium voratum]|nr:unnamed protein product [Effrenium voratum]
MENYEDVGVCLDCLDFATCVETCNSCAACTGVMVRDVGSNVHCTLLGTTDDSSQPLFQSSFVPKSSGGDYVGGQYMNTRHPGCAVPTLEIQSLRFYTDPTCSDSSAYGNRRIYPDSVRDSGFNILGSLPWAHSIGRVSLDVTIPAGWPVMCVLIQTNGFLEGWTLSGPGNPTLSGGAILTYSPRFLPVFYPLRSKVTVTGSMTWADCIGCMSPVVERNFGKALGGVLNLPQHYFEVSRIGQTYDWKIVLHFYVDTQFAHALGSYFGTAAPLPTILLEEVLKTAGTFTLHELETSLRQSDITYGSFSLSSWGPFELTGQSAPSYSAWTTPAPSPGQTAVMTTVATVTASPEDEMGTVMLVVSLCVSGATLLLLACIFRRRIRICLRGKSRSTAPAPVKHGAPVTSSGPSAVVYGGKALLRTHSKEEFSPLSEDAFMNLPKYWNGSRDGRSYEGALREDLAFDELMYVSHESLQHFQDMVTHSYRAITTQDRLCPTGKHDKTRGGCPCVQVGGDPGLPTGFQVKRVIRVEDSEMFTRYITRLSKIKATRTSCDAPDPSFFTRDAMDHFPGLQDVLGTLDDELNEVYLWHGTQVRTGLQIAQEDFNLTFAGSGAGTMYGKGLYFCESATKADEYARDEPGGHYEGVRALLLCRICVGKFHYTQDREPTAIDKYTSGESDSTVGDRAKSVNTYREIVVYDTDQVYPEYLVLYERLQKGETPQPPPKDLPFLLELPLYWKNVGKNPYTEGFREHWVVKHQIKELVQRLAAGSHSGSAPTAVKVRRVEDSNLWCRYINWKRNLQNQVDKDGHKCVPPNELDGNPDSGHVLTGKILEEFHGDEAISVENMTPGLNEMLLWHGTSQKAAEAIAEQGFMVNSSGTHGRRFGNGVYLAEDLAKSMSYASEANGIIYVLLCRATCGHMYYTERDWHSSAHEDAQKLHKTGILANPNKKGPREYILFDVSQVYPEYIIEFKR